MGTNRFETCSEPLAATCKNITDFGSPMGCRGVCFLAVAKRKGGREFVCWALTRPAAFVMCDKMWIARIVAIALDVITAGIVEMTVPASNRTAVLDHDGGGATIVVHTVCSFVLLGLTLAFVIDAFYMLTSRSSSR